MDINYHIKELKYRVFYVILSMFSTSIIAYHYKEAIIYFLAQPLLISCSSKNDINFVYTNMTEAFITYIKVSIYTGIFVCIPLIILNIYRYILPGLLRKEKEKLIYVLKLWILAFILGQIWYYVYLSPLLFKFFIGFMYDEYINLNLIVKLDEFLNFISIIFISNSICFSIPAILLISETYQKYSIYLASYRHYFIFIILIFSGIITPPDVISQITFGLPLIVLLEITYLLSRVLNNYLSFKYRL